MKIAARDVNFGCQGVNIGPASEAPLLSQRLGQLLSGTTELDAVLEVRDQTVTQLQAERSRMREQVAAESEAVRDACRAEMRAAEDSFGDFLSWCEVCQSRAVAFDQAGLAEVQRALPVVAARLHFDAQRLLRALWSARGPGTHAGVNRLLHALHGLEEFEDVLFEELRFLQIEQRELAEAVPAALLPLQAELLAEAEAWMREAEEPPASEQQEQEWLDSGEDWCRAWARLDLAYLARRYADAPTRFPLLNLALGSAWLRSQELVEPVLVECCLEGARRALRELPAAPPALSDEQQGAFDDLDSLRSDTEDVLDALAAWNTRGGAAGLDALRTLLTELADELWSRLEEFPDDAPPREHEPG